jgi:hypothetical protein
MCGGETKDDPKLFMVKRRMEKVLYAGTTTTLTGSSPHAWTLSTLAVTRSSLQQLTRKYINLTCTGLGDTDMQADLAAFGGGGD